MRRRAVIYLCVLAGALGAIGADVRAKSRRREGSSGLVDATPSRAKRWSSFGERRAQRSGALGGDDIDAEDVAAVGRTGVYRVRSAASTRARSLRDSPGVATSCMPSRITSSASRPRPTIRAFPSLWGLENLGQPVAGLPGLPGADIRATDAWDVSTGSPRTPSSP